MATLTPDQIKAKYQAAMPADLAEACNDFWHSIAYLNSKWADYRSLYNDAATVDLLNATAGVFFRDTQLMMRENIFLHLCRLTDNPVTGGQSNLTFKRLMSMVPTTEDQSFRDNLQAAIDDCLKKTEFARIWRNKLIGHTALPPAAGGKAFVIPPVSYTETDDAVRSAFAVVDVIDDHYLKANTAWDSPIQVHYGVRQVLHYLEKGLTAQRSEDAAAKKKAGL